MGVFHGCFPWVFPDFFDVFHGFPHIFSHFFDVYLGQTPIGSRWFSFPHRPFRTLEQWRSEHAEETALKVGRGRPEGLFAISWRLTHGLPPKYGGLFMIFQLKMAIYNIYS